MTHVDHRTDTTTHVTVVESEACHLCVEAQRVLAELAEIYPIEIAHLAADSSAGRDLMRMHRAAMSPLVLLDGEFFSHGRLPRRKLAHLLERRFGASRSAQVPA